MPGEPVDLVALANALVDVLVDRGLVVSPALPAGRVLDAAGVAALIGRDRQWVYAHANELGAFRYGDGPRARLGFDAMAIEQWKRTRRGTARVQRRRSSSRVERPLKPNSLIPYEGSGRGA